MADSVSKSELSIYTIQMSLPTLLKALLYASNGIVFRRQYHSQLSRNKLNICISYSIAKTLQ